MRITYLLSIVLLFLLSNFNCAAAVDPIAQIFELINKRKWPEASDLAKDTKDPVLLKIVLSQKYLDIKCKENQFVEIINFLIANPSWPQSKQIQICAENLLKDSIDNDFIVKTFAKLTPTTSNGHKYYALAVESLRQDPKKFAFVIRSGWRFGNFTKNEQQNYFQKFKKYITHYDHIKKIDHLLWNNQIKEAQDNFHYIDEGYKDSFKTQIVLIKKQANARALFKKVPKKYYTSGLIYRYLSSYKTDLPSSSEVVRLSKAAIGDKKLRGNSFWPIQAYIAREFIYKKKYSDAYKVTSNHFATSAAAKSEAEYLSGWLALNYLKKPDIALGHFQHFDRIVKTPLSKSRGIYWLARTYESQKNRETAHKLYNLASMRYPYTFYGQMSAIELKKQHIIPDSINKPRSNENTSFVANDELTRAAQIVSKYGSNGLSQVYIKAAINQTKKTINTYNTITAIQKLDNVHHKTWGAKTAIEKNIFIKKIAFPIPYQLKSLPVELSLVYSIIRQESVFDQYAVSNAQARGLMQLITPTACDTAKIIGERCIISKLTSDINYNIKLGSNYINQLIEQYNGSYILAIAAYNAGPHNVDKWLNIYGDPRKFKHYREILNWIEHIPFYETRNYVQRTLENLQTYRSVLDKNCKLCIYDDLLRNSKSPTCK